MADDSLATVTDWLGRDQPLARKSLELTAASGGGAVTAPVTAPTMTPQSGPMGPPPGRTGAPGRTLADVRLGLQAAGLTKNAVEFATQFFPQDLGTAQGTGTQTAGADVLRSGGQSGADAATAPSEGGAVIGSVGEEAAGLSGLAGEAGLAGAGAGAGASAGVSGGELALGAAEEAGAGAAAGAGAGAAAGAGTAAGTAALEVVAAAAPYVGAVVAAGLLAADIAQRSQSGESSSQQAFQAVNQVLSGSLYPLTESFFEHNIPAFSHKYARARQGAVKEANEDLYQLHQHILAAAASGDLGAIQAALSYRQGDPRQGYVGGQLSLPPDVATRLFGSPTTPEWSAMSPEQFTQVLRYFKDTPGALQSAVTGTGDVEFLTPEIINQIAGNVAQQERSLLTALVNALPAPAAPAAPLASPAPAPPLSVRGPSGALGFATDLLTQT